MAVPRTGRALRIERAPVRVLRPDRGPAHGRPRAGGVAGATAAGRPPGRMRIVVLRALPGLGDTLCAVPALGVLRARFPDARITYAGLPASRWLRERRPDLVDRHLDLPPLPGLHPHPARRGTVAAVFRALAAEAPDLAIQLHGDGTRSDDYTLAMGAGAAIGPGWSARRGGPKVRHSPAPTSGHEIDRLLAVVRALGAPEEGRVPSFPISTFPINDDDRERCRLLLRVAVGDRPYVVLHPGSSRPETRWPLAGFAAVGRSAHTLGAGTVAVVTGTDTERDLGVHLARRLPKALDLTGRTGLGDLAALLDGAAAVVSNDTGTAHLATAVGAPSVVVFMGGDPERWRPPVDGPHRVVRPAGPSGAAPPAVLDVLSAVHAVHRRPATTA